MIQTFVHIIGYDIWFWISHRLIHLPALYWIHREHHTKYEPIWIDTYHGHPLESLIQSAGFLAGFLVGASVYEAAAALAIVNIKGVMRHDRRTARFVDGGHHLLHHKNPTINYGEPWIDYLCGSTGKIDTELSAYNRNND